MVYAQTKNNMQTAVCCPPAAFYYAGAAASRSYRRDLCHQSVKPEHIITYTPGKLSWDKNTETDSSGAARLFLFDSAYENVSADNGDKTVAPGTQRESVIRLLNESSGKISYRAVLFYKKSDEALPASLALSGEGFRDSENTALPKELQDMSVVRSVTGELAAKRLQELM